MCFVDKQRNAAVVIGNRDLKADVASKRRRERSHNIVSPNPYAHLGESSLLSLYTGYKAKRMQLMNRIT